MTESTDEVLSHACDHCGKRYYRHRYVNRYHKSDSDLGTPVPSKFCSATCRKDAHRVRQGHSRSVPRADETTVPARSVPPPAAPPWAPGGHLKSGGGSAEVSSEEVRRDPWRHRHDPRSIWHLSDGQVRSNWKPSGDGEDMPDIPNSLRRHG
jgi:hypothetical protein